MEFTDSHKMDEAFALFTDYHEKWMSRLGGLMIDHEVLIKSKADITKSLKNVKLGINEIVLEPDYGKKSYKARDVHGKAVSLCQDIAKLRKTMEDMNSEATAFADHINALCTECEKMGLMDSDTPLLDDIEEPDGSDI